MSKIHKMSNNNTKYKDSPLGKIPSDWDVKKLGNFIHTIIGGGTPSRDQAKYWNGNIYWATVKDFTNFNPYETQEKITEDGLKNSSSNLIPQGTIITTTRMALGKAVKFKVDVAINQDLKAIFPKKELDSDFLLFWFEKNKTKIEGLGNGSTVKWITLQDLKGIPFCRIPLPEQTRIAEVLSAWDKAISNVQASIEQVELRNKWLMQELLTGKRRLKGFREELKEVRMKDVFERVTRKNSENNTNVVTISAQRGFVRQTDFFNKNIASEITDNYFLVEKGEFCYNKSYSNGYPWGATKRLNDYEKAVVTTLYICFKIKDLKRSSGDFFEHFFERNSLDRGLTKIAHEGGRAHGLLNVTPSDFFDLKITIPGFEEQTAIAQVLQAAANEVQVLRSKRDMLKEQKKGLMQVLLTGKKRLNVNLQD